MARARKVQVLVALVACASLAFAAKVSPWLAGIVLLLFGAVGTLMIRACARDSLLDRAIMRNDVPELERFVADPLVGLRARLALTYARIGTPDLFVCTCGNCAPGDSPLDASLAALDHEVNAHARLARSFWMPSHTPEDWATPPPETPAWSLPFRRSAIFGVVLARQLEPPASLGGSRAALRAFDLVGDVPLVLKWPMALAAARYAAEIGLYEESERWLSPIPPWAPRSPLEAIRRTYRELLDEHAAHATPRGATAQAEGAFLHAACTDDAAALRAFATDPSHHAALASRVLLCLEGARFDEPVPACPCAHCGASDDDATLAALAALAARMWSDEPFGIELRTEVDALERLRISRHARRAFDAATMTLRLLVVTLHTCADEGCVAGAGTEGLLDDEDLPARRLLALALATRRARRHDRARALELVATVPPFHEGSAIETHRRGLSATLTEPERATPRPS